MRTRQKRPAWVARQVPDRVMAAAEVDGGAWLVLTSSAASVVTENGPLWSRAWHEVDRGEWDGEAHALTIRWVGEAEPTTVITTEEFPRELPLTFRELVERSVVHVESEPALGGGTLRAAVRRAADGTLLVQVLAVGRVRRGAALERQADALETRVRDAVGM